MRKSTSNISRKILIINRFFVSLQYNSGVCALVLAGWLMAVDGHAQTSKTSPFNTIGEGFKKHPEKVIELGEPENDEPGDTIDDADVMLPPADSLRAYLPMVALPLRRISG